MTLRAFVDLPDGMAVRIGVEGLLIGRHRSCDLQLAEKSASRRHALLRLAPDGIELVVLGRQPVEINALAATAVHALRHGDHLQFPGFGCRVRVEPFEESVPVAYALRRGTQRFQIHTSPFIVGSGGSARVVIAGWPDEALRFRIAQGVLYLELAGAPGRLNGAELQPDTPAALRIGDEIAYRDEVLGIEQAADGDASTVLTGPSMLATAVVLHPLPRGGRVTWTFPDGARTVYLPGRRFQLVAALLVPPAPHAPGDYIPDSTVVPIVWDDNDEVGGRQDINVVLARCRQDLVAAGIAAAGLLERAPGGRATRIVLAAGARIGTANAASDD